MLSLSENEHVSDSVESESVAFHKIHRNLIITVNENESRSFCTTPFHIDERMFTGRTY